tara:strand:- start:1251 stop:3371 length:2121 start_codon:yes stop_codon:yes gene_type:complete
MSSFKQLNDNSYHECEKMNDAISNFEDFKKTNKATRRKTQEIKKAFVDYENIGKKMIENGELFNTSFNKTSNCYYISFVINKTRYDYNTSSLELAKKASDIVKSIHSLIENHKTKPIHQCKACFKIFPCKHKLERHQNNKSKCTERIDTINFIKRSKEKFGGRFSYDKVNYINAVTKVIVNCKCSLDIDIEIIPSNHLYGNGGCHKCSNVYVKSYDEIIEQFNSLPGNECIYDDETKQSYTNSSNCILKIKCPRHGYFEQNIKSHLNNHKCDKCQQEKIDKKHEDKTKTVDRNVKDYKHPVHTTYSINIETNILTNLKTKRKLNGTQDSRGTIYFRLNKNTISLHKIKYEAVYDELVPENMEIDHRDQDPTNNSIDNLQCLTKLEHGRKTARDNPNRGKKVGKTSGSSGKAYNPKTKDTIYFSSFKDLTTKLKCSSGSIRKYLKTNKSPPSGYTDIIFDCDIDLIGEKWKKHPDFSFEVSNMGRIKNKRRISYGKPDVKSYYIYSGKRVHKLVMDVWGPPCPGQGYTVDHINNNPSDNRIYNLKWASKKEQCLNQRTKNLIKPRKINGYTGEIIAEYESMNKLRETEGINSSVIHNTSSVKREWFINLNPAFLNRDRLHIVKGVLAHIKRRSKGIPGFTECNTKNKECYEYKLTPTKFCKNKNIFVKRKRKIYHDAYDIIKEIAIQNNNARIIQCYFRSYLHFRDF